MPAGFLEGQVAGASACVHSAQTKVCGYIILGVNFPWSVTPAWPGSFFLYISELFGLLFGILCLEI
jgi:hypothetical protein